MSTLRRLSQQIDWVLIGALIPILLAGLVTMNSFGAENTFFSRQLMWIGIGAATMIGLSFIDFRFLRRTQVVVTLYALAIVGLVATLFIADPIKGSQRWIDFGFFSLQVSDPIKIILIILLAKYFSRRHIEIAHIKHILISGVYVFILFALIFFQPDLGSAIILFLIWLGMVLVAGISKKHLALIFILVGVSFGALWTTMLADYQKERVMSFLDPLADIQGAGYNAFQSTIAVGSGQLLGKGVGYGTQSKLQFLPEFETDFIFASYAEEWGFIGVVLLLILYAIVVWRILRAALYGASNFEMLYASGLVILFMAHTIIHIGMNIGLLPVTGTTLPFMSYGGSHLMTEFVGLGILFGMRRYERSSLRGSSTQNEIVGI